jgi:hypothetical protein
MERAPLFLTTVSEAQVGRNWKTIGWSMVGWTLVLSCAPSAETPPVDWWALEADAGLSGSESLDVEGEADCERFPDVMMGWSPADAEEPSEEPSAPEEESTCPPGIFCPDTFPFHHAASTADAWTSSFDHYNCDPEIDESGPEVIYRVKVTQEAFLSAAVYDGSGVDVDVHILSAPDPTACIQRGHHDAGALVKEGVYYVVVDTWADDGVPLAGDYVVHIGLTIPSRGPCDMESGVMKRVGDGGDHLGMPATGPVVMEAHLVTDSEPPPYPAYSTEGLTEHYSLSQEMSGFVMNRDQVWAPLEGGNFHGAGIASPTKFPAAHEAWYVCMFWTSKSRPDKGTRMLFRKPGTDLAVVVAAGYETGPGNLSNIAGTVEETHFFLKTGHKSTLTLGIAEDQGLPLGPRICE